jgi:hypothetical protein
LRRLFRRKNRDPNRSTEWPYSVADALIDALKEQAEGVAFFVRELTGVMSIDADDSFWSLTPRVAVKVLPATEQELVHFCRYKFMSRLEVYYSIMGKSVLVRGVPMSMMPEIEALRLFLRMPRLLLIELADGPKQYLFSIASRPRFDECPMLYVDIKFLSVA